MLRLIFDPQNTPFTVRQRDQRTFPFWTAAVKYPMDSKESYKFSAKSVSELPLKRCAREKPHHNPPKRAKDRRIHLTIPTRSPNPTLEVASCVESLVRASSPNPPSPPSVHVLLLCCLFLVFSARCYHGESGCTLRTAAAKHGGLSCRQSLLREAARRNTSTVEVNGQSYLSSIIVLHTRFLPLVYLLAVAGLHVKRFHALWPRSCPLI